MQNFVNNIYLWDQAFLTYDGLLTKLVIASTSSLSLLRTTLWYRQCWLMLLFWRYIEVIHVPRHSQTGHKRESTSICLVVSLHDWICDGTHKQQWLRKIKWNNLKINLIPSYNIIHVLCCSIGGTQLLGRTAKGWNQLPSWRIHQFVWDAITRMVQR